MGDPLTPLTLKEHQVSLALEMARATLTDKWITFVDDIRCKADSKTSFFGWRRSEN